MKDGIVIPVLLLLATVLVLIANFDGIGYTHDSYYYIHNAELVNKIGIWDYVIKYGLKQQLLTLLIFKMGNICTGAAAMNAILFVLTTLIWIIATKKYFPTKYQWYAFCLLLVFSTPLLLTTSFLWTEPLFHFLLALLFLNQQLHSNENFKRFLGYLIILPFLLFARKAGMLIIFGVLIFETLQLKPTIRILLWLSLGFLIYIFYGYTSFPNIIGEQPQILIVPQNLWAQLLTISKWITPFTFHWLAIASLICLMLLLVRRIGSVDWFVVIVFGVYFVSRLFFQRELVEEHERYLSVMYPFYCLALGSLVHNDQNKIIYRVSVIFVFYILFYNVIRAVKNVIIWSDLSCVG